MLREFLESRKALALAPLCREAGVPENTLFNYMNKGIAIPQKHRRALLIVLRRYGYKSPIL